MMRREDDDDDRKGGFCHWILLVDLASGTQSEKGGKAFFGDFHLQNNPYTEELRSAKCGLNQGGEGIYMNCAEK